MQVNAALLLLVLAAWGVSSLWLTSSLSSSRGEEEVGQLTSLGSVSSSSSNRDTRVAVSVGSPKTGTAQSGAVRLGGAEGRAALSSDGGAGKVKVTAFIGVQVRYPLLGQ
jgi:hypothetical protein